MSATDPIGVDIGGSGVKAARVDLGAGALSSDRLRIETPQPATPEAVAAVVTELVASLGGATAIGVTVPAVVRDGIVGSAANIDPAWIGTDAEALFAEGIGQRCVVINDADAAGIAEMRFGAGMHRRGVVMLITLGTGIGSALFVDGVLVPNTELGHLELGGQEAEKYASSAVRDIEDLSWAHWGDRVGHYLDLIDRLFSPELIIVGGGVSKRFDRYAQHLAAAMSNEVEVVPAQSLNAAGIVGAALAASPELTDAPKENR